MKSTYWKFLVICAAAAGLMIGQTGCQSGKLAFPKFSSWAPTPPKWLSGKNKEDDAPPPSMHFNQNEMLADNTNASGLGSVSKSSTGLPSAMDRPSEINSPKSSKLGSSSTAGMANASNSANSNSNSTSSGNPPPFRLSQPEADFAQPSVAKAGNSSGLGGGLTPAGTSSNGLASNGLANNGLANNGTTNQPSRTPYQYQGSSNTALGNATSSGFAASNSLENAAKGLTNTFNQSALAMKDQVSSAAAETQRALGDSASQIKNDLNRKIGDTLQSANQTVTEKVDQASNALANVNPLGGSGDFLPMGKSAVNSPTASGNAAPQFGGFSNPTNPAMSSGNPPAFSASGNASNVAQVNGDQPFKANPLMPNSAENGSAFALSPQNPLATAPSAQSSAGPNAMGLNAGSLAQTPPTTPTYPGFPPSPSTATTPAATQPSQSAGQFQSTPFAQLGPNAGNSAGGVNNSTATIGASFPMNSGNLVQPATGTGQSTSTNQPASFTAELPPELLNKSGNYAPGSTGQFK